MARMKDLTGQKFGRLTVIEQSGKNKHGNYMWRCLCECGNIKTIVGGELTRGNTKSCGCLLKETMSKTRTTHGKRKTRLYSIWADMKTRCYNPKDKSFERYGKKGVTVCDEWLHDFQAFYDWSMLNGYADNLTIDRINNDKGYSPDNCRWTTVKVQANNTRRNHYITYKGETLTLKQWSEKTGINYRKLIARVNQMGWDFERAITTP